MFKNILNKPQIFIPAADGEVYIPVWKIKKYASQSSAENSRLHEDVHVLQSERVEFTEQSSGALFHELFENKVDELGFRGARSRIAVEYPGDAYSYSALEKLANRIARYLLSTGVQRHDRIAVLFDRSMYSYAATLAVTKVGGAFVPLDASFPRDRVDYMIKDSEVSLVLTVSRYMSLFSDINTPVLALDAEREHIDKMPAKRVVLAVPQSSSDLCYVIYTSGSTGRPKGVPITHQNIVSFLLVANHCYGYQASDRVYQALTLAFDYSVEEIWLPLLCGATLVPAPMGNAKEGNLAGEDLSEFILSNKITALCCVPTLLATLDEDLPSLRFLMVSGEACPQIQVDKWANETRRFLNTYGPTETTVSATWQVVKPASKVTIGGPLPGYSVVILEPGSKTPLMPGEAGEICIAGVGLASGYLNLAKQTEAAFIEDFIGIDDNPSGKIYRTGDLGLIDKDHQIQYLGRIDSQIKIRGYRIELSEIESVLGSISNLSEVAVCAYQSDADFKELVAYYTMRPDSAEIPASEIQSKLQESLPDYMVPAYYQKLDVMPHLPSGKIDRKSLPAPQSPRLLASGKPYCEPGNSMERQLAVILAGIMDVERVSVNDHFFDDLAANSLLMAKFVTRIRRTLKVKGVSLKKIYQNPTISSLAVVAQQAQDKKPVSGNSNSLTNVEKQSAPLTSNNNDSVSNSVIKTVESNAMQNVFTASANDPFSARNKQQSRSQNSTVDTGYAYLSNARRSDVSNKNHSNSDFGENRRSYFEASDDVARTNAVLCGVMQCVVFLGYLFILSMAGLLSFNWVSGAETGFTVYLRAIITGTALFFGSAAVMIVIKWLAVGRMKVEEIPIWSVRYFRFWIARNAVIANPLNMLRGTPLYNVYLRLLGANIGKQAVIYARPPVCCDLVTVGRNCTVREDVFMSAYSAEGDVIRTGTINLGAHCYVGVAAVLDINTSMGDASQLGHASALLENQHLPEQSSYHGSPAEPADVRYDRLPKQPVSNFRRNSYAAFQLLAYVLVVLPLVMTLLVLLSNSVVWPSFQNDGSTGYPVWIALLGSAALLYLSGIALALVTVMVIPRLIHPLMKIETVHPIYGWQFYLGQLMNRFSNSPQLNMLFGDSSMILHYLKALGYNMKDATQTGSNFGVDQRQHSPFLCRFGRNTLVSDSLRISNMQVSNSSYKISSVSVPADMYLGNALNYPVGATLGENCLIGTKTMIPIDGPILSNTGVLGSPAFSIPRSVQSDHKFDHYLEPGLLKQRLKLKLQSNLVTLAIYMIKSWLQIFIVLVIAWFGTSFYRSLSVSGLPLQVAITTVVAVVDIFAIILFSIFCERMVQGFKTLKPLYCSLYDRRFWQHERFWKMSSNLLVGIFNGTPLKPFFNRLRGAKIGVNMFDDGMGIVEPDLVEIGDNCTSNLRSIAQSHSLEDGTFKSDRILIGNNCNLGVGAFIHYGVVIQDNCTVLADSFVMKGAVAARSSIWGGNPAYEIATKETSLNENNDEDPLGLIELGLNTQPTPVGGNDVSIINKE